MYKGVRVMKKKQRINFLIFALVWITGITAVTADESAFVRHLEGREKLLYVLAGDDDQNDNDYFFVIDADPASRNYGRVTYTVDLGSRGNEVHHSGFTADRKKVFAGSLYTSRIFILDVGTDPSRPRLEKVLDDVEKTTGYCCPHTFHALPDSVIVTMLGAVNDDLPGGLAEFSNDGKFLGYFGPGPGHKGEPVYMYDVGVKPEINRMITSSFAPRRVYRAPFSEAREEDFGDKVIVWDYKERKILQTAPVDKSPLEVRWLHNPVSTIGFINCSAGNSVWMWRQKEDGSFAFKKVIDTGAGSVPTDMRISQDDKYLYVTLFGEHEVHQYDISDPDRPVLTSVANPGPSPQMIHLSHDGKRMYVSNSVLSAWDYSYQMYVRLIHIGPDGMKVDPFFNVDFNHMPAGRARPHDMLLAN